MKTIGVLCGGFGGVEIGAMQAGLKSVWSIEIDPAIAEVAQKNLHHKIIVADILDIDPATVEQIDILHASLPCPNFSIAKAGGKETEQDIALATKTAEFIKVLKPQIFTLENVWLYRKSQSWQIINDALTEADYWFDMAHVNSADFGIPQTRKRMIVRAIRGGFVPYLPQPEPWQGWHEAIEDLIPELPESEFALWQLARMPDELKTFIAPVNTENLQLRYTDDPMATIAGGHQHSKYRSFIVDCQKNGTIKSNGLRGLTIRQSSSPIFTMTAMQNKRPVRAFLSQGKVVSMMPRCLARFQSFPDWYELPENNKLACKGIGNALPPLWYEKIARGLIAIDLT